MPTSYVLRTHSQHYISNICQSSTWLRKSHFKQREASAWEVNKSVCELCNSATACASNSIREQLNAQLTIQKSQEYVNLCNLCWQWLSLQLQEWNKCSVSRDQEKERSWTLPLFWKNQTSWSVSRMIWPKEAVVEKSTGKWTAVTPAAYSWGRKDFKAQREVEENPFFFVKVWGNSIPDWQIFWRVLETGIWGIKIGERLA